MAKSLILRPQYDISAQHSVPSGFSGVWDLINEEKNDGDSTRIEVFVHGKQNNESELTSEVGFHSIPFNKKNISQIVLTISRKCQKGIFGTTNIEYAITSVGQKSVWAFKSDIIVTIGYVKEDFIADETLISAINSHVESTGFLPEIRLKIHTNLSVKENKDESNEYYITQAYITLAYKDDTIGVHKKVGGAVKAATAAYRKLGGSWVEITEEEAKDVLRNNIITEGKT